MTAAIARAESARCPACRRRAAVVRGVCRWCGSGRVLDTTPAPAEVHRLEVAPADPEAPPPIRRGPLPLAGLFGSTWSIADADRPRVGRPPTRPEIACAACGEPFRARLGARFCHRPSCYRDRVNERAAGLREGRP